MSMATSPTYANSPSILTIGRTTYQADVNVAPDPNSVDWPNQVHHLLEAARFTPLKQLFGIYHATFYPIHRPPPLKPKVPETTTISTCAAPANSTSTPTFWEWLQSERADIAFTWTMKNTVVFGEPGSRAHQPSRTTKAQQVQAGVLGIPPEEVSTNDQPIFSVVSEHGDEPKDYWGWRVAMDPSRLKSSELPSKALGKLEFLSSRMTGTEAQQVYKRERYVSYTREFNQLTQQKPNVMIDQFRIISDYFYELAEEGEFKEAFDAETLRDRKRERTRTNQNKGLTRQEIELLPLPELKLRKTMWWWFKFAIVNNLGHLIELKVLAGLMREVGLVVPQQLSGLSILGFFRLAHFGSQLLDTVQLIRLTIKIQSGLDPLQTECHDDLNMNPLDESDLDDTKQTSDQPAGHPSSVDMDVSDTVSKSASGESSLSDAESAMDVESETEHEIDESDTPPSTDPTTDSDEDPCMNEHLLEQAADYAVLTEFSSSSSPPLGRILATRPKGPEIMVSSRI